MNSNSRRATQVKLRQRRFSIAPKKAKIRRTIVALSDVSAEEMAEYREVFCFFDTDKSGDIDKTEVQEAMKTLGLHEDDMKEVDQIIGEVDSNKNGLIEFEEFCIVMKTLSKRKTDRTDTIQQCFDVFDVDDSGSISEPIFRVLCKQIGGLTDEMIDFAFAEAHVLPNGSELDLEQLGRLVEMFVLDDDAQDLDDDEDVDDEYRTDTVDVFDEVAVPGSVPQ